MPFFPILSALILAAGTAATPAVPLRIERFSTAEGLSQNSVYCMLQDRLGFLWVGSENGIDRYDGYGFQPFRHDPTNPGSLSSNQVRAAVEDGAGAIWIGTADSGLARYDYKTNAFTTFRHRSGDPDSLVNDDVRALAVSPDGTLWAGTAAGISCLRPSGTAFRRLFPAGRADGTDPRNSVIALAVDAGGALWAGTEGGLFRSEGRSDRLVPYADSAGPLADAVGSLAFEDSGTLWVGTSGGGAARLDLRRGERRWWRRDPADPSSLSSGYVSAIVVDHSGRVWLGTADRGLNLIDRGSANVTRVPLVRDVRDAGGGGIGCLLEDRSRILWIGTGFQGLLKTDLKASGFVPVIPRETGGREIENLIVFAVAEDREKRLWIGESDALYQADPEAGGFRVFHPDPDRPDRPVYAILPCDDGALWVGTWEGGLIRLDPETGRRIVLRHDPADPDSLAHDRPLTLLEDSRGRLWVGTWGGGLDLFDRDRGLFLHHRVADGTGLASDRIRALCEGADGTLWVGTTGGGLSRFNPDSGRFATYLADPGNPDALSHNDIAYILRSRRGGTLWLATGGGLNRFDPDTGRFKAFRKAGGLPNDAITAVLEDGDGMIWVAHFAGITRIDPATSATVNFDTADGLAGTEFNAGAACASFDGTLLFGGVGGVTRVLPDKVSRNPHPPRTVLTAFTIYGREADLPTAPAVAQEVRLPHDQDFLSFEFTGLEFTAPQRNTYAYRMAGYHQDWVACGTRRFATYTGLSHGSYTFEVRSANNHGLWGHPARLRIIIDPPFWETWWFRSAALSLLMVSGLAVFGWRTRALRLRLAAEERLVTERTAQLASANAELRAMASRDELTGVANRKKFNEFLRDEWRRSARFSRSISLAILDIDDFKLFNDAFGHPAGDDCLKRVAGALQTRVNRPGDLFARYGGEEFVAVLSETGRPEAVAIAERMRVAVADLKIAHPKKASRPDVTISVGVATIIPVVGDEASSLLAAADAALYSAKKQGKNRVVAAESSPDRNIPDAGA